MFSKPPTGSKQPETTANQTLQKTQPVATECQVNDLFPSQLKPGGDKAIIPVINSYTPNVNADFYNELELAIKHGIAFTCLIVDAMIDEQPFIENCIKLINFCKENNIPIINFQHEPDIKNGLVTHPDIASSLDDNTTTIVKPTLSIFSSDQTHETLRSISPDAIIIAGGEVDLCVMASIIGKNKESSPIDEYGEEFGAVEYGYPVYLNDTLIYPNDSTDTLNQFTHDLVHRFSLTR